MKHYHVAVPGGRLAPHIAKNPGEKRTFPPKPPFDSVAFAAAVEILG